jgi:hypothetical protein
VQQVLGGVALSGEIGRNVATGFTPKRPGFTPNGTGFTPNGTGFTPAMTPRKRCNRCWVVWHSLVRSDAM